ncbi:MAG TPA: hypothetical protein VI818_04950 [Candidatus Thermoplasmatota archaeon]|nr:hypothetical protein [Candidatus Thermoplasmatota archaeon]
MPSIPTRVLETEAAIQIGLLIRAAGYEVDATPRPDGADLAAGRRGTIWATFHVDMDRKRPLFLRVGATVWGGARVPAASDVAFDAEPDVHVKAFVRDRLALACKKGREESPDHCDACPDPTHRAS